MSIDLSLLENALITTGMSAKAAHEKRYLFESSVKALGETGISQESISGAFFIPGRIEVLGKHTDYAGGSSIVAATEKGICLIVAGRNDPFINVLDAVNDDMDRFRFVKDVPISTGHWSCYPRTVARRLANNYHCQLKGADIVFASDLPRDSGMSSSSALMIAIYMALAQVNHFEQTDIYKQNIDGIESLAVYLACVENGHAYGSFQGDSGVGTFGGSEDHLAILCSQPNRLSQYSYAPVQRQRVILMPEETVLVVMSSGVVANKTGAARDAYNNLSGMIREITEVLRQASIKSIGNLGNVVDKGLLTYQEIVDLIRSEYSQSSKMDLLIRRIQHFFVEHGVVIPGAVNALLQEDLDAFGNWVDQSQSAAENLLCNQTSETIYLAQQARKLGAVAATSFGAGFGGSVWALVRKSAVNLFMDEWTSDYLTQFPQHRSHVQCFETNAGPPATTLYSVFE
jgi:galactokinase